MPDYGFYQIRFGKSLSADELPVHPALDHWMLFAYCQLERKMAVKETYRLYTLRAGMYIEVKYCDDTRPEQQLARATEQHTRLKHALAQQCHKVSLHTVLIAVMGTIHKCHTELPLGLDKLGLGA